jgi:beta-lactamase class A
VAKMNRRIFSQCTLLTAAALLPWSVRAQRTSVPTSTTEAGHWRSIEVASQGRLGVAVLDTRTGLLEGHRLDERFPMCSTFKWLAAAHVLHRVDRGSEQLDRRIHYGRDVLLPHSPLTAGHADADGMTLAELCHATITTSDNAAGNLILKSLGGPRELTRYARSLGDRVTSLDRWEPDLNEAAAGDPRDTTSPRAMAGLLNQTVVGGALSTASRAQLARWLLATRTNLQRLATELPDGWQIGSKTGTGPHGTTNDVGIYWPASRPPIVVAAFLTESKADITVREAAIAQVARAVTGTMV